MKGERVKQQETALPGAEHRTSNFQRPTSKAADRAEPVYDLEERLLEYSARIIRLVDALPNTRAANHVGGQLLRSGTAPLPNHGEAQAAESINDFIHKLKIGLKELRESFRWLRLIKRVPLVTKPEKVNLLIEETDQLIRIFVASIQKARSRSNSTPSVAEGTLDEDGSMLKVGSWMFDVQPPAGPSRKEISYRSTTCRRKELRQ